ncbi:Acyl-CoA dehydrogenase, short-chain specific [bioreactor metagenome]|uniref:Acyl-CoA dehydrogenase, short-chain specific n=1 Tax=bioreactor metagenome TaxID=1076179 RepID=A0A645A1P5_9ZZZZ
MIDFSLSEDHLELQSLYRKFAEERVKPLAREMDEKEEFSMELLQEMQEMGLLGIPFSEELGGSGLDVLSYALCIEELSKIDASTSITVSVHTSLCSASIEEFGNAEQKEKFLRPLINGSKVGCFGLTEPNAGSDAGGARTVAVKDGDEYVITGSKIFTTNSGFADIFLVFALTDKSAGPKGMSAFLVEKGTPGLTVTADIPRMGIRAASNSEVVYEEVRVPAANLLGGEGKGFKIAMKALDGGRIGIAAQATGIAQGAINETIKYVKERVQFGKTIASFQNTQFKLADMQTKVDAARLLTWRAAVAKDKGENYSVYAAMAKLQASAVANEVTRDCVQLMGGYGYAREYTVERFMRDAKITEIYEGTSEVMRMVISGSLNLK